MSKGTTGPPGHRGDVQGLRAIAVLAVIAAHAAVPGFGGGFVGVDVFFVLSGFLITRLILASIVADGRFRLGAFYARRARRILPAATVVLALTVAVSVVYLNFLDALDATRDALWAAFFGANIRFAGQGVDYFALESSPSPVQHYWSLAVEEQFYVVWPVLVALAVLLSRRRRRPGTAPVRTMTLFAVLVGGASLAWSVHRTAAEPASAYFSTFTRAWELAAGVLVALALHSRSGIRRHRAAEPLAVAGLAGLTLAVVSYDTSMAFPGYQALLPALSTVALILAGSTTAGLPVASRVLTLAPLRAIGDWSYSLYLWHWPLLVIPQVHLGRPLSAAETGLAVAAVFVLGHLTHRFVEQPFRTRAFWRRDWRALVLYPVSLAMVLPVAYGAHAYAQHLGGERGDDPAVTTTAVGISGDEVTGLVEASVVAGRRGWPIPSDLTPDLLNLDDDLADVGDCDYQQPERPLCRRGSVDSDQVLVVTGDSHARAWIPAFEQIAERAGYATYYLVKQQCPAAFVDVGRMGAEAVWPECTEFHDWVVDQVADLQPDLMVVATSPPPAGVYDDSGEIIDDPDAMGDELAGGFDDMFAAYGPLVGELVLLSDVPRLPDEPGPCLAERGAHLGDCAFTPISRAEELAQLSVDAAERSGVRSVDPTSWICADGLCPVVVGSTITYRDRSHLTATRAAELWSPLGVELGLLDRPRRPESAAG